MSRAAPAPDQGPSMSSRLSASGPRTAMLRGRRLQRQDAAAVGQQHDRAPGGLARERAVGLRAPHPRGQGAAASR